MTTGASRETWLRRRGARALSRRWQRGNLCLHGLRLHGFYSRATRARSGSSIQREVSGAMRLAWDVASMAATGGTRVCGGGCARHRDTTRGEMRHWGGAWGSSDTVSDFDSIRSRSRSLGARNRRALFAAPPCRADVRLACKTLHRLHLTISLFLSGFEARRPSRRGAFLRRREPTRDPSCVKHERQRKQLSCARTRGLDASKAGLHLAAAGDGT